MGNFIINLINYIVKGLGALLSCVVNLLPNSPFASISNSTVSEYLGGLAWVIPFPQIVAIGEAWLTAIIVYYTYMAIMRWIKVIG